MNKAFQARLAALGNEVRTAAVPDGCKQTVAWCMGQLPTLYAKFRQTNESRYGDDIARLLNGLLKELATSQSACPAAQKLADRITHRLQFLHEQFGLPELSLKPFGAAIPSVTKGRLIG